MKIMLQIMRHEYFGSSYYVITYLLILKILYSTIISNSRKYNGSVSLTNYLIIHTFGPFGCIILN